jgi:hypothetical protein
MFSAILTIVLLLTTLLYLREQKAQARRIATQRDVPREQLLPRHYKSFVKLENRLWAATGTAERASWDWGNIRLPRAEGRLVRDYVQGLRDDFSKADRIFSVVIGRSPNAEILRHMEAHRMKLVFPYYVLCTVVRLRLWTDRVSLKELRRLTEVIAAMAYEVRLILNVIEREGRVDFVEALLRRY